MPTMQGLFFALSLGLLIASPQLWQSLRYYPRSVRSHQTFAQKTEVGNISLWQQLRQAISPTTEPIDGVFGTEACTFIGLPALCLLPLAPASLWWGILFFSSHLTLGNRFGLYRWTHWCHLRIPARYTYLTSVSLAMLAIAAFADLPARWQSVILLLQCLSLILVSPRLWPMLPYCQRWARPQQAFLPPVIQLLSSLAASQRHSRVSGLAYPLRCGHVNRVQTLGYNGSSQSQWMARLRQDHNPHGTGAHDWFQSNEDGEVLDWYGVRWAWTYRPLRGKWRPTALPHLYENSAAAPAPSWKEAASAYGDIR